MIFSRPLWLLAAIAALLAAAIVYRAALRRREARALLYSNLAFVVDAARGARWIGMLFSVALLAAGGLLALAAGGAHVSARLPAKDGAAVLCIDTSGSMRATDVEPNRSEAARSAARRFISEMPAGTRLGIVAFAGAAGVVQPLTADPDEARNGLDRVPEPNGATAIGDALATAAHMLPPAGRRIVVLLTDGVNNRGSDPLEVAHELRSRGITVYTVGVGTKGSGQLIPGTSEQADIDEDALSTIAQTTGGSYVRATSASELQRAFATLARTTVWERRKIDASLPLAIAGGVSLGVVVLAGLALGRFP